MMLPKLYRLFIDYDCSLLEINPLVITAERASLVAMDAKVEFDSNALYRHKGLMEYRDKDEEDPLELIVCLSCHWWTIIPAARFVHQRLGGIPRGSPWQ